MTAVGSFERPGRGRAATLIAIAFLLVSHPAFSQDCVVTDFGDDGGTGQLRWCIETVAAGGTVAVPAARIVLSVGQLVVGKDLTILGAGPGLTVLEAGPDARVFKVGSSTLAPTVVIGALSIRNGRPVYGGSPGTEAVGGGVENFGTLTLTDLVVEDCEAEAGGGIDNRPGASMTLQRVTVRGNSTRPNLTPPGGGILNGGIMTILDSTISDNSTTTVAPTASANGGGVMNAGLLTIVNSTISGNTAGGSSGGGIHNAPIATGLSLTNVTITDNYSASYGGGLSLHGGGATVVNSIIAGNRVPRGTGTAPDCSAGPGGFATFNYNLLGDSLRCTLPATASDNILDEKPRLQALGDNGGATETHALLPPSPAIDAGSNDVCPLADQRGQARPVDGNRDGVSVCDMGAYERSRR